jgi:hypothetical protein
MALEGRIFNAYGDEIVWKNRVDRWKNDTWQSYAIAADGKEQDRDKVANLDPFKKKPHHTV